MSFTSRFRRVTEDLATTNGETTYVLVYSSAYINRKFMKLSISSCFRHFLLRGKRRKRWKFREIGHPQPDVLFPVFFVNFRSMSKKLA